MQFSLRKMFVAVALFGVVFAISARFGFITILIAVTLVGAAIGWGRLLSVAPEVTKYLTVFAVMGLIWFSILSVGLLRARENARLYQCFDRLRQASRQVHRNAEFRPAGSVAQSAALWEQSMDSDQPSL